MVIDMTFTEFTDKAAPLDFQMVSADVRNRHYVYKTPDGQHIMDATVIPGLVTDSVNRWKVSLDGEEVEFVHLHEYSSMDFALSQIFTRNIFEVIEKNR